MIYIITHGRPNKQLTLELLRRLGCNRKITLVLDDEDSTLYDYAVNYCADELVDIVVFNKEESIELTDTGVRMPHRNFAVFARNAVEQHAKDHGYNKFWVFDDDLTSMRLRYIDGNSLKSMKVTSNVDDILSMCEKYMDEVDGATFSFGTANNYIGGVSRVEKEDSKHRLCYNAFLRNLKWPVDWSLNMCEDRITSVLHSKVGELWLQLLCVQIDTEPLGGVVDGGNSEVYRTMDKFHQVFFPVMTSPDCNYTRFNKKWLTIYRSDNICPKIVSGRYRR